MIAVALAVAGFVLKAVRRAVGVLVGYAALLWGVHWQFAAAAFKAARDGEIDAGEQVKVEAHALRPVWAALRKVGKVKIGDRLYPED